jgi:hypothetical protein
MVTGGGTQLTIVFLHIGTKLQIKNTNKVMSGLFLGERKLAHIPYEQTQTQVFLLKPLNCERYVNVHQNTLGVKEHLTTYS